MKEKSSDKKKNPLTKKGKILLAISAFLFLLLCLEIFVLIYRSTNMNTNKKQEDQKEEIIEELQDENEIEEQTIEEDKEQKEEDKTEEKTKSPKETVTTTPKTPQPAEQTPSQPPTPEVIPPRQQVERLWTNPTGAIMRVYDLFTINSTKYLIAKVERGTIRVGDTLKQTGICGIVPNQTTKITRIIKKQKPVDSIQEKEEAGIVVDNDAFYAYGYYGSDLYMTRKAKLKVYVLTKAEGNTTEQSIINGKTYMFHFVPKNSTASYFIEANAIAVTPKPINMGEVADIEFKDYIMFGGFGFYEPGARIQILDAHNKLVAIGAITGYPSCPH